jgi:hypothetical protein
MRLKLPQSSSIATIASARFQRRKGGKHTELIQLGDVNQVDVFLVVANTLAKIGLASQDFWQYRWPLTALEVFSGVIAAPDSM